jgi:hypothetical protein
MRILSIIRSRSQHAFISGFQKVSPIKLNISTNYNACRPIKTENPGGNALRRLRLDLGCSAIAAAAAVGLSGGASAAHASEVRTAAMCLSLKA